MRRRNFVIIAAIPLVIIAAAAVVVWPQQQQASLSPDRILKGTAPIITITVDKGIQEIKGVRVAGLDAPVQKPLAEGKVSVQLPKLDFVGLADVAVIGNDDKPVAVAQLTYAESSETPSIPVPGPSKGLALLLIYVGLIVLLPIWATLYDIRKSYEERKTVFDKLRSGEAATPEQTSALLKSMDQGPTGLTGLTRGLIALTLILVLAIAAFHLIVFAPKVPDIADKLLTLLAGTLTAITGFYFGSKAATEAAAAATASQTPPGKAGAKGATTPKISKVDPNLGTANTPVTLSGEGFGAQQGKGKVTFGGKEATAVKSWDDNKIEVTVPASLTPGQSVDVVATNDSGNASGPSQFQVK
jgi:hypothetical protein